MMMMMMMEERKSTDDQEQTALEHSPQTIEAERKKESH